MNASAKYFGLDVGP